MVRLTKDVRKKISHVSHVQGDNNEGTSCLTLVHTKLHSCISKSGLRVRLSLVYNISHH